MTLFEQFEMRRRVLQMSQSNLAQRSGVALPVVCRMLADGAPDAKFQDVASIAEALGLRLSSEELVEVEELRKLQAQVAARRVVRLVQGTSALEGQGLEPEDLEQMLQRTTSELLAADEELWSK